MASLLLTLTKKTGSHIPCSEVKEFDGTKIYASPYAHKGLTLSRRDDLISWIYSLVEMIDGSLPWTGKKNFDIVGRVKNNISAKSLCSSLPSIFADIYQYLLKLEFEESPNYENIKTKITNVLSSTKEIQFDWDKFDQSTWKEICFLPKEYYDTP